MNMRKLFLIFSLCLWHWPGQAQMTGTSGAGGTTNPYSGTTTTGTNGTNAAVDPKQNESYNQATGEVNTESTGAISDPAAPSTKTKKLSADQQGMGKRDTTITQRIRQEIMKQQDFSTYAQNVKIITVDGKVTLKGPVRSEWEQDRILKVARKVAGPRRVVNQMEIVPESI